MLGDGFGRRSDVEELAAETLPLSFTEAIKTATT
jgi:hypothetical protein